MRTMAISYFESNQRTIIHYQEDGEERIREEYKGIAIKSAERKFRLTHGLKGLHIKKHIINH